MAKAIVRYPARGQAPEIYAMRLKYFKKIDNTPPTTRNFIYAITKDGKNFWVHSTGHTDSGTYYIG